MIFNLFFNPKFEKLINELAIPSFGEAFSISELTKLRDEARDGYGGTAEEAAARAFRDLIVLNQRIPVEQRLEASFSKMGLLKIWHFDGKVNIDLHLGVKKVIEDLVSAYVGKNYEDDYYDALRKSGVIVPITHDMLHTIALGFLYGGKKITISPDNAAHRLLTEIIVKDQKYSGCLTPEASRLYAQLTAKGYKW